MNILHALVGYLTVTSLPFCLFAFVSLVAAIDYDGYVNTTQNHVDGALMKRLPGASDIIEARQEIPPPVVIVIALVVYVALSIVWVEGDDPKREAFTQDTINHAISQYPKFNWVICHSPYSVGFDGVEDTDWGYTHHELSISYDRTIGYDLYWARSGTFYRYGDGGFINWAYNGNILSTDDGGGTRTVHFGIIS